MYYLLRVGAAETDPRPRVRRTYKVPEFHWQPAPPDWDDISASAYYYDMVEESAPAPYFLVEV